MGVVAIPSSLGLRYIDGFFFFPLNISALAVEQSWFWYLSAPSIDRLWFPTSLGLVIASFEVLLFVRGFEPDLGAATFGAGGVEALLPREMEDLPEETEDTEDRGVLFRLILLL